MAMRYSHIHPCLAKYASKEGHETVTLGTRGARLFYNLILLMFALSRKIPSYISSAVTKQNEMFAR